MQAEIAQLVHPVLSYGVELKARLDRGEEPELAAEQAELTDLLLSDFEARRCGEFGGEAPRDRGPLAARSAPEPRPDNSGQFLGIRYALVCWLDELFTCYSPWSAAWNEHKLEVELYGSNDRAWRFWEQAKLAQSRPGGDALEAFYLCVALGFRGELREQPEGLHAWTSHAKTRLGKVQDPAWPLAAAMEPPTRVPPLRGRERMQRMVLCGWLTLLGLIPLAAYCLVSRLGS
jgi:type VI secretion system protein ImpK